MERIRLMCLLKRVLTFARMKPFRSLFFVVVGSRFCPAERENQTEQAERARPLNQEEKMHQQIPSFPQSPERNKHNLQVRVWQLSIDSGGVMSTIGDNGFICFVQALLRAACFLYFQSINRLMLRSYAGVTNPRMAKQAWDTAVCPWRITVHGYPVQNA